MLISPVRGFDCGYLYKWFKKNCWECQIAHGECFRTAKFVELVFGLKTETCSYHAWNITPDNAVLDLTVEQFGRQHYDQWVAPDTVFDVSDNRQVTYSHHDHQAIAFDDEYLQKASIWLCVFSSQLQSGKIDPTKLGLSKPELNKRVVNGIHKLNQMLEKSNLRYV